MFARRQRRIHFDSAITLDDALPARVRTAPPPPLPPAAVSTTGVPRLRFRSSTSSQVRRYDMRSTRPAAEIEPERAISSSTATLPGPIRAPDARSSRMLNRSLGTGRFGRLRRSLPHRRRIQPPPAVFHASPCPAGASLPLCRDDYIVGIPSPRQSSMRFLLFACMLLVPLLARAQELTVFAAASLTDAMKDVSGTMGAGRTSAAAHVVRLEFDPGAADRAGRAGQPVRLGRREMDGLPGREEPDRRRHAQGSAGQRPRAGGRGRQAAARHDRPGLRPAGAARSERPHRHRRSGACAGRASTPSRR